MRVGTLNIGTMTGRGRDLAGLTERKKMEELFALETQWKEAKRDS